MRKLHKAGWLVFILLMIPAISNWAFAEENTLTITLDPPAVESPGDSPNVVGTDTGVPGAPRPGATPRQSAASTQAIAQNTPTEVAIGRVGVTVSSQSEIRRHANSKGAILFRCPKDTYLALTSESGDWYGVLMIDSSMGWISKKHVNVLDYQVVGSATQTNSRGSHIVNTALKYLGIRYRWGGYSMDGLDCSGFVKAVFESHGISLPRVSREQATVGTPVGWSQLQAGDRLYFASKGGQIDHTGIYMGNGHFIHSASSRGGVVVDSLNSPKWNRILVSARR